MDILDPIYLGVRHRVLVLDIKYSVTFADSNRFVKMTDHDNQSRYGAFKTIM